MPSPLTETRTLTELADLVLAEGRPVDLADAELLVGWENAVIKTGDGWIYRFPRLDRAEYERELVILKRLAGKLPVRTPDVVWTGRLNAFAAYRTIDGAAADCEALRRAPNEVRRATARSLADFLVAMHGSLDETERAELGIGTQDPQAIVAELEEALPTLPPPTRDRLRALLAAYQQTELAAPESRPVVLHGDFHFGNLVLDQPTGVVAGVWDFSCVEYGNPASDLRYLIRDRAELGEPIADSYAELSGRTLDLDGARLVGALEDVTDALAEDRPVEPVLESAGF